MPTTGATSELWTVANGARNSVLLMTCVACAVRGARAVSAAATRRVASVFSEEGKQKFRDVTDSKEKNKTPTRQLSLADSNAPARRASHAVAAPASSAMKLPEDVLAWAMNSILPKVTALARVSSHAVAAGASSAMKLPEDILAWAMKSIPPNVTALALVLGARLDDALELLPRSFRDFFVHDACGVVVAGVVALLLAIMFFLMGVKVIPGTPRSPGTSPAKRAVRAKAIRGGREVAMNGGRARKQSAPRRRALVEAAAPAPAPAAEKPVIRPKPKTAKKPSAATTTAAAAAAETAFAEECLGWMSALPAKPKAALERSLARAETDAARRSAFVDSAEADGTKARAARAAALLAAAAKCST